jgi:hypothetical protein
MWEIKFIEMRGNIDFDSVELKPTLHAPLHLQPHQHTAMSKEKAPPPLAATTHIPFDKLALQVEGSLFMMKRMVSLHTVFSVVKSRRRTQQSKQNSAFAPTHAQTPWTRSVACRVCLWTTLYVFLFACKRSFRRPTDTMKPVLYFCTNGNVSLLHTTSVHCGASACFRPPT